MRDKKRTILVVVAIAVLVAALVATIIPVVRASSENGLDFSATGSLEFDAAVGQDMQDAAGEYPTAQLEALDRLIAYIDAYYGFESSIVAHNEWRSSNSDMSAEFAGFLGNYKDHRSYKSL